MSSSKRGALEEAMAAWRDSIEIGLTVAKQVRKAESSFVRTFKSVARGFRRRASRKKTAEKMAFDERTVSSSAFVREQTRRSGSLAAGAPTIMKRGLSVDKSGTRRASAAPRQRSSH